MRVNETTTEWLTVEKGDAHFRRKQLGATAGSERLGTSLYELPAGGGTWPYHYHTGNEEALYVLAGTGTLRLAGEEQPLQPGDYVALPAGEEGAHRVRNDGDDPLRFLLVSTMSDPDVLVYPDSGKVGVMAGAPPGGDGDDRHLEAYYQQEDAVDYWDGE